MNGKSPQIDAMNFRRPGWITEKRGQEFLQGHDGQQPAQVAQGADGILDMTGARLAEKKNLKK